MGQPARKGQSTPAGVGARLRLRNAVRSDSVTQRTEGTPGSTLAPDSGSRRDGEYGLEWEYLPCQTGREFEAEALNFPPAFRMARLVLSEFILKSGK